MRRLFLVALAVTFVASLHCHAQSLCPWINAATAEGVLDVKVKASVQETPGKDTNCIFKSVDTNGTRSLVVEVHDIGDREKGYSEAESKCTSAPTPVRGLGNEAFECVADHSDSHAMMIIGRVREKLFVVSVIMTGRIDRGLTAASLEDKVTIAAGQVVGNLF
jgi:hypothetical protein